MDALDTRLSLPRLSYALALCASASLWTGAAPERPGIYVDVSQLRNGQGQVRCGLFAREDNWLSESPARGTKAAIHQGGTATCAFPEVKPGVYAVTVLHDEDGDGHMTTSALGLPQEGYAASRNAVRKSIARPEWDDAKFHFGGDVEHLKVRILYP